MKRRNIVIVDDDEKLAIKVAEGIRNFYLQKNEWNYDIMLFNEEGHFKKAKIYISESVQEIDILVCDQKLVGGQGIELFRLTDKEMQTDLESIIIKPFLFRVLQSNQFERFFELQDEHNKLYERFVNSDNTVHLVELLTYFETKVLPIKENGNPKTNGEYYKTGLITKLRELIRIDGRDVKINEILFLYLDNENSKRDTYHFVYFQDEKIRHTTKSLKPTSVSEAITALGFLEAQLKEDNQVLCKINPLWVLSIVPETKTIKLFTPFSSQYVIYYSKMKSQFPVDINFQF